MTRRLGLGTVQFGKHYGISNTNGKTSEIEIETILTIASNHGIDILDTALAYGRAETELGKYHDGRFKIISKFPALKDNETLQESLNHSLRNLGVTSLYGYLAHDPKELLRNESVWQQLVEIKESGRVGKIGFSLNEPEELDQLMERNLIPDLIQVPYNYFDRRFEDKMRSLKELGCEVHTRSAFLQGLFFMPPEDLPPFFEGVKKDLAFLQSSTKSLEGALLNFALCNPYADRVIIGVESSNHLLENIKSLEAPENLPPLKKKISDNIIMPVKWPKK